MNKPIQKETKIGDIVTFPQMLDDPDWKMFGERQYRITDIKENGDMSLEMVKL